MVEKNTIIVLRLFGPFSCRVADSKTQIELGAKPKALIALLATAPEGTRTRTWLQEALWPLSGADHGRASLRQALSSIKRQLGEVFEQLFSKSNANLSLDLTKVEIVGQPTDGQFLEGIDIPGAQGFEDWLRQQRQALAVGKPELFERASYPSKISAATLRPAVAILPFVFVAQDGNLNALGDMLAADVSRQVSRAPGIDVISHLSCRNDGFRESGIFELKSNFSVDYLVTGHCRLRNDELIVNSDFIDVSTGQLRSTKDFNVSLSQVLQGHHECAQRVAGFIGRSICTASMQSTSTNGLKGSSSHTLMMSAVALMHRQDLVGFSLAREQLEEVNLREETASLPLAWLAKWYVLFISQGWSTDIQGDIARAKSCADRAIGNDPSCSFSRVIAGLVEHQLLKRNAAAAELFDQVLEDDESNSLAWLMKGTMFAFEGQGSKAVAFTDRARHLSPLDPSSYLFATLSASAYLSDHRYVEALELAERSIRLNRNHVSSLRAKVVALHGLERMDEARETAQQLLHVDPDLTVDGYLMNHAAAEFSSGQEWAEALANSGIPRK